MEVRTYFCDHCSKEFNSNDAIYSVGIIPMVTIMTGDKKKYLSFPSHEGDYHFCDRYCYTKYIAVSIECALNDSQEPYND